MVRLATAGLALLGAFAPSAAPGQEPATARACPADIPAIRMGVQNLLDISSSQYTRLREDLAVAHLAGERLRVLVGGADASACERLIRELPRAHRASWNGASAADFVLYRVGDRYLVAIGRPGLRRRPAVPQFPERLISYDLEFQRLAEAGWP